MTLPGLRQRVLRGFVLFSVIQFFLLVALAIYSYHYSEDRALARLVQSSPDVWREYDSIEQMPVVWRTPMSQLSPGTHELSGQGLHWLEGSEMHVYVSRSGGSTIWRVLKFDEEASAVGVVKDYGLFVLLAVILLLAFGGWAAWLIAHRVSRPLEQLASAVGRRQAGQSSVSFAEFANEREVALLGNTLDDAFGRVDAAMSREKTLSRNISHELRTPLTVISTALHGGDDPDHEFRRDSLDRARRASGEMELLTAACLELGREEVDDTDHASSEGVSNVAETIKEIVRESLHLIGDRSINVDVVVDDRGKTITARRSLVRLAVGNAVRNAFVHGESGEVVVTLNERVLTIENPVDGASRPAAWGAAHDGHGFGLNILGQSCEKLGWRVSFDQATPGRAIVTFHFASA